MQPRWIQLTLYMVKISSFGHASLGLRVVLVDNARHLEHSVPPAVPAIAVFLRRSSRAMHFLGLLSSRGNELVWEVGCEQK